MGELFRSTVVSAADTQRFDELLTKLNQDAGATGAMLVDESSGTIARSGEIPARDFESMGALLACNFTAAQELAFNLSRSGFTGIVQKGPEWNMMATRIDRRRFLVVFYPQSVAGDMQKFRATLATARAGLAATLRQMDAASPARLKKFAEVFTTVNRMAIAGLGGS